MKKTKSENEAGDIAGHARRLVYEPPTIRSLEDKDLDQVSGGLACASGTGNVGSCVNGVNVSYGSACGSGGVASGACGSGNTAETACSNGMKP